MQEEQLHEKLSLLIDDQLDRDQASNLLETVRYDEELSDKLRRYALISQALKSEQCSVASADFVDKIHQQLKHEPTYFLPRKKDESHIRTAGLAVAASVLLAAVWLSSGHFRETAAPRADVNAIAKRSAEAEQMNADFKEYLQAHDNVWYVNNNVAVQSYARVASYQQK